MLEALSNAVDLLTDPMFGPPIVVPAALMALIAVRHMDRFLAFVKDRADEAAAINRAGNDKKKERR